MGRTSNITKKLEELSSQFKPIDLNEENVQAIFSRCLDTSENEKETSITTLFPPELGYEYDSALLISFNNTEILKNKKNIEYLYGQLNEVHKKNSKGRVNISDYTFKYSGNHWTTDKGTILKLLYLYKKYI